MWFSACELMTFVLTGDHAIQTHRSKELFLGRAQFMMHECQRILNGETASTGPVQATFKDILSVVTLGSAGCSSGDGLIAEPVAEKNKDGARQATGMSDAELGSDAASEPGES